jgi:hypothetical protein
MGGESDAIPNPDERRSLVSFIWDTMFIFFDSRRFVLLTEGSFSLTYFFHLFRQPPTSELSTTLPCHPHTNVRIFWPSFSVSPVTYKQ